MVAKRLIIDGQVQGVGYRASFAAVAVKCGLAGWVRNRMDGSVEACVHGEAAAIEAIIAWAKAGPPAARVSNVAIMESDETLPAGAGFRILPSA